MKETEKTKGAFWQASYIYVLIVLAGVLRALNLQIFILPFNFAPGGVTGISAMLQYVTGWNSGIFLLIFNLPIIIVSAFFLGRTFAVRTAVAAAVTSGLLFLFSFLETKGFSFSQIAYLKTDNQLLAGVAGGVLSGLSVSLLLKCGSSTGGSDIIATIVHKKRPHLNLGKIMFAFDACVVVASVFVYKRGLDPLLLAFVLIFVSSFVCDTILAGTKSAVKFEIITSYPERVTGEILEKVGRGVTLLPAKGMFSQQEKFLLICIVRKRQVDIMQKIIKENPDTFCFVSSTSDVYGNGFRSL